MLRRRILVAIATLAVLLLLIPRPGLAQKVIVDFDKATDFSIYRAYQWKEGTPAPNPLAHQRIVTAIEKNLELEGIARAEADPDMYVIYHASIKEELSITDWGHAGPRWGWSRDIDVRTIPVGELILDFVDAKDGKLFWRGIGSDTVSSNPETNEKRINKAVEKMFKKYPPAPK